jgi:two-component system alkaline phosphatase synthesis response regulator PhoP
MATERILVVEDDAAVAKGLIFGLENEGYQVRWAKRGREAVEAVWSDSPQLILLDIRLPDISGFDVCSILRARGAKQPIVMLTARDEEVDRVLGLELGADDYIVKPFSLRELISRVRAQLRRAYGELASSSEASKLVFDDLIIDLDRMTVSRGDRSIHLTPSEFRILHYLASHSDRALSRADLIENVWGFEGDVGSERTIDVHVRHLRQKLEDDPARPRWIQTVRGVGYTFVS